MGEFSIGDLRKSVLAALAVLVMVLGAVPMTVQAADGADGRKITTHEPITIASDADFTPANGVTEGKGTKADPYVISEYDITASGKPGISITGTTKYFLITYCQIHDVKGGYAAIALDNTSSGQIDNSVFTGNSIGIQLVTHSNIDIAFNTFDTNNKGIYSVSSTSVDANNNTFKKNDVAIDLVSTNYAYIEYSTFTDNAKALAGKSSGDILFEHNSVTGSTSPIDLDAGGSKKIYSNTIIGGTTAIYLKASGAEVKYNLIDGATTGIDENAGGMYASYNTFKGGSVAIKLVSAFGTIDYNDFMNYTGYAIDSTSDQELYYKNNNFVNNNGNGKQAKCVAPYYPQNDWWSDNYWDDWTTPDSNSDGYVDTPYQLDGDGSCSDAKAKTAKNTGTGYNPPALTVSASASVTSGSAPLEVIFTVTVSGGTPPYKYYYEWADGSDPEFSTNSATHTFTKDGTFNVLISVTDQAQVSKAAPAVVIMVTGGGPALEATATADKTSGDKPLQVKFSGGATGGTAPYTYSWAFGDGNTDTSKDPTHTYQDAGTYSAVLTVTDSKSNVKTAATITIVVTNPGGGPALTVTSSADKTSGDAPLTVMVTGTASGGTAPYTYSWAFGDGDTGTGASVNHIYKKDGTYYIVLTVTDSKAISVSATAIAITVGAGGPGPTPLAISASGTPTTAKEGSEVAFVSTASGGVSPYTYSWDFKDNTSSSDANPKHTFTKAGTYAVTLTVKDALLTEKTTTVTITVEPSGTEKEVKKTPGFEGALLAFAFIAGLAVLLRRRQD